MKDKYIEKMRLHLIDDDISGEFEVVGHLSPEEVTELMVELQSKPFVNDK